MTDVLSKLVHEPEAPVRMCVLGILRALIPVLSPRLLAEAWR
jgi:hypothetical protein